MSSSRSRTQEKAGAGSCSQAAGAAEARPRVHSLNTLATPSLLEVMIWDGFPGLAAML